MRELTRVDTERTVFRIVQQISGEKPGHHAVLLLVAPVQLEGPPGLKFFLVNVEGRLHLKRMGLGQKDLK